ncbi:MAG: DUF4321 domain-containing protein [Eubacteriales bacterium]
MRKSFWLYFFLVCAGIVLGSMLADLTAGFPALSWLSYGLNFGTQSPLVLDLNAITLTFGITLNITISTLLCVALALVLGRCILEK